jgi:enoyl-CoA hydratase
LVNARVVDEHVDTAELFDHRVDRRPRSLTITQVDGKKGPIGREIVDLLARAHHDRCARIVEASGDSATDAPRTAGDEYNLAFEVELHPHQRVPPWFAGLVPPAKVCHAARTGRSLTCRQVTVRLVFVGITVEVDDRGIAEIVVDCPPVNALAVADWFELASTLRAVGADSATRVVILRAEGGGFNAGVDIKEMQRTEGFSALLGANKGCFSAFAAVYDCPVPVIAAVHGFCVGGGIGLVGNADVIVASDDAYFGLPEVDRGALGAATHLSRLVPQHKMRAMVYTGATATATELHHFGSVLNVVPRDQLRAAALAVAESIAAKSPTVMRAAKESLNGIDLWDVKRSYRFEQGFTFELNLSGVSDELRDAFVDERDANPSK